MQCYLNMVCVCAATHTSRIVVSIVFSVMLFQLGGVCARLHCDPIHMHGSMLCCCLFIQRCFNMVCACVANHTMQSGLPTVAAATYGCQDGACQHNSSVRRQFQMCLELRAAWFCILIRCGIMSIMFVAAFVQNVRALGRVHVNVIASCIFPIS